MCNPESVEAADPTRLAVRRDARRIRVVAVDDHPLILEGIREILRDAGPIELVGEAYSGADALDLVRDLEPDVVLLDLRMPDVEGLSCLEAIRRRAPTTKVVVLSASTEPRAIRAALRSGAAAYVVKSVNPVDLPSAIRQAVDRTVFQGLDGSEDAEFAAARADGLSDREIAILQAVASGLSNQAIGKTLWVSDQTIKFHLRNIYRKLGVSSRTEAARYAHQRGLVGIHVAEG